MQGTFKLSVALGNAAMQTGENLGEALRFVIDRLDRGQTHGNIRDINGNTVGRFALEEYDEDDD